MAAILAVLLAAGALTGCGNAEQTNGPKKRDERLKRFLPLSEEKLTEEEPSRLEERWQAAVDCIDHDLTDQTASVIRLCYREGMSYKDTAEELGISISAVNKHIVKGLRMLREKLKGKQSP